MSHREGRGSKIVQKSVIYLNGPLHQFYFVRTDILFIVSLPVLVIDDRMVDREVVVVSGEQKYLLGPCHTRYSCTQYCDKKIKETLIF